MKKGDSAIPAKLLFEAVNLFITVELKNGDRYSGELAAAAEGMSVELKGVKYVDRSGKERQMESAFIRGSMIKFFVFPKILQQSPMLKKAQESKDAYVKDKREKRKKLNENKKRKRA